MVSRVSKKQLKGIKGKGRVIDRFSDQRTCLMLVYSAMTEVWIMMVLITQYLLNAILYIKSPIKLQIVTKILKALFKVQKKREV